MNDDYTVGLDLGTTSIGWVAIRNNTGRIWAKDETPGCGVRHFRESVNPKNNVPYTRDRGNSRRARRTLERRVRRKRKLRQLLERNRILPTTPPDIRASQESLADKKRDPSRLRLYELRTIGLTKQIALHDFGTILMQLAARRGFKSSRKSGEIILVPDSKAEATVTPPAVGRGKKKAAESDKPGKPKKGSVTASITSLVESMQQHGSETVGQHLFRIGKGEIRLPQDAPGREHDEQRIRGRHLLRRIIAREFDLLWDKQQEFHEELRNQDLRKQAQAVIFYQRPLKSSKHLIGRCECIPKLPRCPRADWFAMQWRVLKDVNHLRIWNDNGTVQELTAGQRKTILAELCRRQKVPFAELRSIIDPPLLDKQMFNLEAGVGDRANQKGKKKKQDESASKETRRLTLPGNPVEAALVAAFGPAWDQFDEPRRAQIRVDFCSIDDADELAAKADGWGLSHEGAHRLARQSLPDGYMAFSRVAIQRMIGEFQKALSEDRGITEYEARERCGFSSPPSKNGLAFLPPPTKTDGKPVTNNPVVRKALFEVRKVVNAIIQLYGKPPTRIIVEFARRMRLPLWNRKEVAAQNDANRKDKESIRELIRTDFGKENPSGNDVLAFRLWKQQGFVSPYSKNPASQSPYTGRAISQTDLRAFLRGEGILHIDHILPYSRTLDDSMNNKCLCFQEENDAKGDNTPLEWLGEGTEEFNAMLQRVASMKQFGMPFAKRRRFSQKEVKRDSFIERQLKDTQFL